MRRGMKLFGNFKKIMMPDVNECFKLVFFCRFITALALSFPVFFKEVLDSLHRAYKEKVTDENLVNEIKSFKCAYIVQIEEVISLVTKGLLSLPQQLNKVCFHHHTYFVLIIYCSIFFYRI